MAAEKKATKFTLKLARKILGSDLPIQVALAESGGIFVETAKKLPEGKLKNELTANLQHYLELFQRACQNESHDEPEIENESEFKSNHFEFNLYAKEKGKKYYDENNFSHDAGICFMYQELDPVGEEIDFSKFTQSKKNSKDKVLNLSGDIKQHCDMLCGAHQQNQLQTVMKICYRKIQECYEDLVNKKNNENLRKLVNLVKETLAFFHFKFHRSPVDFDKPSYEDLLSATLSVYLDLSLILERKQNEEEKKTKGKEITSFVVYLLNHALHYIPEVILQQSAIEVGDEEIILPLCFRVFSDTKPENHRQYTAYIAVMKLIEEKFGSLATQHVKQMALKFKPQKGYLDLLKEVDDEIPDTKYFKGVQITQFLLNEAKMDTVDLLLDLLTGEDDSMAQEETETKQEEEQQKTKKGKTPKKKSKKEEEQQMEITIDRRGAKLVQSPKVIDVQSEVTRVESMNPVEEVVISSGNEESCEEVSDEVSNSSDAETEGETEPMRVTRSPKQTVIDLENYEPEAKKSRKQKVTSNVIDLFVIDKSPKKSIDKSPKKTIDKSPKKTIDKSPKKTNKKEALNSASGEIEIDSVVIKEYESESDIEVLETEDTSVEVVTKDSTTPEKVKEGKDIYEFESDSEATPVLRKNTTAVVDDGSESDSSSICSETGLRRSLRVRTRRSDVHSILPDDSSAMMDVDAIKDKILSKMPQLKTSRRRSMPAKMPLTPTRKAVISKLIDSPMPKCRTPKAVSQKIEKLQMEDSFDDLVLPTDSPGTPVRRSSRRISEMSDASSMAGDSPPKAKNLANLRRSGRVRRYSDMSDASSVAGDSPPMVKNSLPRTPTRTPRSASKLKSKLQ